MLVAFEATCFHRGKHKILHSIKISHKVMFQRSIRRLTNKKLKTAFSNRRGGILIICTNSATFSGYKWIVRRIMLEESENRIFLILRKERERLDSATKSAVAAGQLHWRHYFVTLLPLRGSSTTDYALHKFISHGPCFIHFSCAIRHQR